MSKIQHDLSGDPNLNRDTGPYIYGSFMCDKSVTAKH